MPFTFQIRDYVGPIQTKAIKVVIYVEEDPGSNVGRNIDHNNWSLSCYPRVLPGESHERKHALPVGSLQLYWTLSPSHVIQRYLSPFYKESVFVFPSSFHIKYPLNSQEGCKITLRVNQRPIDLLLWFQRTLDSGSSCASERLVYKFWHAWEE